MNTVSQSILPTIEEEGDVWISPLCEIKRQQNARLPVARLPPEILSDIFVYGRDAHIIANEAKGTSIMFREALSWMSVSHVSHFWRETAISAPRLWTCIDLRSTASACEFIHRARGVPVEIEMPSSVRGSHPSPMVVEAACNHPGKISSIKLYGDTDLDVYISLLAGCSADILHTLHATSGYRVYFMLPDKVTHGNFPKLEALHLVNGTLDPQCTLLHSCAPTLCHILLQNCIIPSATSNVQQAHFYALLDALRSMHSLVSLDFMDFLDGTASYIEDNHQYVLPTLHDICIAGDAFTCSAFLRHIDVPRTCHAQILAFYSVAASARWRDLAAFLGASPASTPELTVDFRHTKAIYLYMHNCGLELSGDEWYTEGDALDALKNIAAVLFARASRLVILHQRCSPVIDHILYALFMTPHATVTELIFERGTLKNIDFSEVGFLPRLESVGFKDFDMHKMQDVEVERWVEEMLERKKAGGRLGVDFRGCSGVPMAIIERLKEHLDWVVPP